jgi:hypothetical protein
MLGQSEYKVFPFTTVHNEAQSWPGAYRGFRTVCEGIRNSCRTLSSYRAGRYIEARGLYLVLPRSPILRPLFVHAPCLPTGPVAVVVNIAGYH